MNNIHLKTALIVPFITLTIFAVGAVGYLSFENGQKAVNEVSYQLQSEISKRIASHLQNFLSTPIQINQINAAALHNGWLDIDNPKILELHFWEQLKVFKSVSSIYVGNALGGLVNSGRENDDGSQYIIATDHFKSGAFKKYNTDTQGNRTNLLLTVQNFDARTRPWYRGAVDKGTDFWSSIYILFTGQDLAVASSRPVYDKNNKLLGVVSIDLFLSHISKFLKTLSIGKNGYAFIIEQSGLLVASSSEARLFTESGENIKQHRLMAAESSNENINYAAKSLRQHFADYHTIIQEEKIIFKIKDQQYSLLISPMNEYGLDWLIAVVVSEDDFMSKIKKNNILTGLFIIITLVVVLLLCIFIAQKIAGPVLLLNTAAQNLAKGMWGKKIKHKSRFAEINMLTLSFNEMAGQLQQMLKDLQFEISERKQLKLRLEKLVETSTDWIWECDENNLFTYSSMGVTRLLGYKPQEIIGKSIFDLIPSSKKEKVEEEFTLNKDRHKAFTNLENINQHKNSHLVTIESSGSPIFNSNSKFKGYIGINRNISERKKMEEDLRQSHKMESVGTLAGGISHDFNNILSIIIGNTDLVLDNTQETAPFYNNIKEIKIASLRAKDVIGQLLSFSRKTEQKQRPLDITKVIYESLKLIRASMPSSIEIRENIPQKIDTILADTTQIHQIVINLCTNASHAMMTNGGVLEVTLHSLVLDQKNGDKYPKLDSGKYLELIIKDTGAGIDPKMIDKIFDPYFTTKGVGQGSGLGLSVVHGIVKNHNGEIFVNSTPGKGTSFNLVFPTIDEMPEEIPIESDLKLPFIGTEKILFVDDESSITDVAIPILSNFGYKVEAATDPLQALALFKKAPENFDIVISDLTMPQMSGLKLSEKIKSVRSDIPIIICTGNASLIDEKSAQDCGIDAYEMKPVSMIKIAELIRSILDK